MKPRNNQFIECPIVFIELINKCILTFTVIIRIPRNEKELFDKLWSVPINLLSIAVKAIYIWTTKKNTNSILFEEFRIKKIIWKCDRIVILQNSNISCKTNCAQK